MPYHVEQDGLEEARLSKTGAQFGSTKRGIAYAYGDKYMKKTLRMGDLLHLDDAVKKRLVTMVDSKNLVMEAATTQLPSAWMRCGHGSKSMPPSSRTTSAMWASIWPMQTLQARRSCSRLSWRSARHRFRHLPLYHLFQRHRCLRPHRRRHPGPQAAQLHRRDEGLLLLRG